MEVRLTFTWLGKKASFPMSWQKAKRFLTGWGVTFRKGEPFDLHEFPRRVDDHMSGQTSFFGEDFQWSVVAVRYYPGEKRPDGTTEPAGEA
jgi:hypothetical protein